MSEQQNQGSSAFDPSLMNQQSGGGGQGGQQQGQGGGGGGAGPGPAAMHPLAVLIDELKSDDVSARLTSIHRLTTIALALGPQRTRDELIPFINEGLDDEECARLLCLRDCWMKC